MKQTIRYLITIISSILVFFIIPYKIITHEKSAEMTVPSYTTVSTKYQYKNLRIVLSIQDKIDTIESLKKMMHHKLSLTTQAVNITKTIVHYILIRAYLKGPYSTHQWVAELHAKYSSNSIEILYLKIKKEMLFNYGKDQGIKLGLSTGERMKAYEEYWNYEEKAFSFDGPLKYPDIDPSDENFVIKFQKNFKVRSEYEDKLRDEYESQVYEKYGIDKNQFWKIYVEGSKLHWPLGNKDWREELKKEIERRK